MRLILIALTVLACSMAWTLAEKPNSGGEIRLDGTAEAAYRAGDYELAANLWKEALVADGDPDPISESRGHLCYNIGNAMSRDGMGMEAIAWYQAAERHLPRDEDLRANLSYVRGEKGLPPASGDGMTATISHWIGAWTPVEGERLALVGLAIFALVLALEAFFGGARWRTLAWLGAFVCLLLWLPWLRHTIKPAEPSMIVIAERGAAGRSEPRSDALSLMQLEPTEMVYPLGTWQDWIKVRTGQGKHVWVNESKVHSIWR